MTRSQGRKRCACVRIVASQPASYLTRDTATTMATWFIWTRMQTCFTTSSRVVRVVRKNTVTGSVRSGIGREGTGAYAMLSCIRHKTTTSGARRKQHQKVVVRKKKKKKKHIKNTVLCVLQCIVAYHAGTTQRSNTSTHDWRAIQSGDAQAKNCFSHKSQYVCVN